MLEESRGSSHARGMSVKALQRGSAAGFRGSTRSQSDRSLLGGEECSREKAHTGLRRRG